MDANDARIRYNPSYSDFIWQRGPLWHRWPALKDDAEGMTSFSIIPAIDIKDGRCVRLYQGNYDQVTVFDHDPVAVARKWEKLGAERLHIVDLDGAKAGRPVNAQVVFAIVRAINIPVQLGGGLRDHGTVDAAFQLGVERIVLGTAAIREPGLIARLVEDYADRVIVGVDARDGWVAAQGWLETSQIRAGDLIRRMGEIGVSSVIYTDIARDGTMRGPNLDAIRALVAAHGPDIIASGGVSSLDDLVALAQTGARGVIVGRALYTGAITLSDAISAVKSSTVNY